MRGRPPSTVVAYVAVFVAVVLAAVVGGGGVVLWFAGSAVFGAGLVGIYYRSRVAWLLLTSLQAGQLIAALAAGLAWWVVAILTVQVALLLAPPTRRYFRREPPPRELGRAGRLWRATRVVSTVFAGMLVGLWGLAAALAPGPISGDLDVVRSDRPGIRVLFVGNTLTSDNGMTEMLSELAEGDPQSVPIFPVQYARRGSTLEDAEDDSRLLELIPKARWNYVVLQEHSQVASRPGHREGRMFPAAAALDMLTGLSRSQTLLFMTGAYEDGDQDNVHGDTYEAMQARLEEGYTALGARIRNAVVPVGVAWRKALEREPGLDLWADDGRRPSEAGSYLTACVFYGFLEGRQPGWSSFTAGLDRAEARLLARIAWRAVMERYE